MTGASGGGGPPPGRPFPRRILAGDTLAAARALLGARLVRDGTPGDGSEETDGPRVGRIVEVEAYIGEDDRASHARMGPTPRNRVMFGSPGIAYVYLVYGIHHCLNVVTEADGYPAAILLRSAVPVAGAAAMRAARLRRARDADAAARLARVPDARLTIGPGNLGAAFDVMLADNGADLCDVASPLRVEARPETEPPPSCVATARIGVDHAGPGWAHRPWRFVIPEALRPEVPRAPRDLDRPRIAPPHGIQRSTR